MWVAIRRYQLNFKESETRQPLANSR
jgi:hypothetical protein